MPNDGSPMSSDGSGQASANSSSPAGSGGPSQTSTDSFVETPGQVWVAKTDLKPGAVGLTGAIMQNVTHIAPAIAAFFLLRSFIFPTSAPTWLRGTSSFNWLRTRAERQHCMAFANMMGSIQAEISSMSVLQHYALERWM